LDLTTPGIGSLQQAAEINHLRTTGVQRVGDGKIEMVVSHILTNIKSRNPLII
jgi:hypothetical protein